MNFSSAAIIEFFKKYDFSFFLFSVILFIFGIINLYSATHASSYMSNLYKTQIGWYLLSFVIGVGVSCFSPKSFYRYSYAIYFINLALLVLVLVLGHKGMGAQRWLVIGPLRFQPSEMMKISSVLALSRWFSKHNVDQELGIKELIIPFLIAFFPMLLIVLEPDLGTGLLILLIFLVIAFYRKLKWKTIIILAILGTITSGFMYQFGLKNYQKRRISTFLDPTADAHGSGYNAIQSKIAIGSGQIIGKGFKKSSQASLNYLPENHTDFIFSIYNEEHGFIGALFLITIYLILFFRFIWLSQSVTRMFDSIMAIGLMSIFFWHTFINMGMVMGLIPVVGLPLPLMSYGGSSLLTFGVCCGLATSLSNSRNLF
jgi:rod shape determining protein RodA